LVAPVCALPAGSAVVLTIEPEIVIASIQSRFMIAYYPILK
jgi:hypothetical protein